MTLSLAELLEGTAPAVYQHASGDTNPPTMRRFFELSGLYKRKYYQRTGRGGPLGSLLASRFEGALLDKSQWERYGPRAISSGLRGAAKWVKRAAVGPAAPLLSPTARLLNGYAEQQEKVGAVLNQFVPFTAQYQYIFRCDNTRAAYARLSEQDKERINWRPEAIDWRDWFLNIHIPALEKWVFPRIDERIARPRTAPRHHLTLPALLSEMAERHDLAVALQRDRSGRSFPHQLSGLAPTLSGLRGAPAAAGDSAGGSGASGRREPSSMAHRFLWDAAGGRHGGSPGRRRGGGHRSELGAGLRGQGVVADEKVASRVRGEVEAAVGDGINWLDLWSAAEPGPTAPANEPAATTWRL